MRFMCSKCLIQKSYTAFFAAPKTRRGVSSWCRKCYEHARRARPKHRTLAIGLKYRHGLKLDAFYAMLRGQNYRCGCCRRRLTMYNRAVDHDHKTGKIRGILCRHCNMGLGQLGDTISCVRAAVRYLGG